jgi:hypothetical protein
MLYLCVPTACLCLPQELDDTASFRNIPSKWGEDPEFPLPFGRTLTAAEEYVHTLDEGTGVINPGGGGVASCTMMEVWGGGCSKLCD